MADRWKYPDHDLDQDIGSEHRPPAPEPRLSPTGQLQRSLGNQRLIQMRAAQQAAVQRYANPMAEAEASAIAQTEAKAEEVRQEAPAVSVPGGGEPLPSTFRHAAEQQTGVKMDDVQMVKGGDQATRPISALAFTTEDAGAPKVVLDSSVDLKSQDGQFTLMHELSHVAQQKRGQTGGLAGLGGDDGARTDLENKADHDASCALKGPHKH